MNRPVVGAVAAMAAVGIGVAAMSVASGGTETTEADKSPLTTVVVEQQSLVEEDRYDGTLLYPDYRTLSAASADAGSISSTQTTSSSVVTAVVDAGVVLSQGDVVFELDTAPTVVMFGDLPMYRSLSQRSDPGDDILQLEQNLSQLGYDPDRLMTIDGIFDADTAMAVDRWERDLGLDDDGVVDSSQVLFLPGSAVVSSVSAGLGEAVNTGAPIAEVAVTESVVTVMTRTAGEIGAVFQGDQPVAGDILFAVDDLAVVALIGDEPITRDLSEGDEGPDVRLLQENLLAMGYGELEAESDSDSGDEPEPLVVNGTFDAATTSAVEALQFDVGREVTGVLELGDVAVVAAGHTVVDRFDVSNESEAASEVPVNEPILSLRSSDRAVEVELEIDQQDELAVGTEVLVSVPGVGDIAGRVASVSPVVTVAAGGDATATEASTVTVVIVLNDAVDLAQVETPVDVYVERVLAEDVLTVPVSALIALSGGGFAIEVVDGATTRFIAVTPGSFEGDDVEVSGDGVVAGMEVVAP